MLKFSAWDTICLRFIPREFPLSTTQRDSAQRLLRKKAWSLPEFLVNWLLPETLFGSAAAVTLMLLAFHWIIALTAALVIAAILWLLFAIHLRARAEPYLCEVLLDFGFVICPACYYWLGKDTQEPRSCPECGAQAHVTQHDSYVYR